MSNLKRLERLESAAGATDDAGLLDWSLVATKLDAGGYLMRRNSTNAPHVVDQATFDAIADANRDFKQWPMLVSCEDELTHSLDSNDEVKLEQDRAILHVLNRRQNWGVIGETVPERDARLTRDGRQHEIPALERIAYVVDWLCDVDSGERLELQFGIRSLIRIAGAQLGEDICKMYRPLLEMLDR